MFKSFRWVRRAIPQSISVRLLLAVIGSIVAAQLFSGLIYVRDRNAMTSEWSALDWSERVGDLVGLLDSMTQQQRLRALQAIAAQFSGQLQPAAAASAATAGDQQFLGLLRAHLAQRQDRQSTLAVMQAVPGTAADVVLANQRTLQAYGPPRFVDVQVAFVDGQRLVLRLQVMPRQMAGSDNIYLYPLVLLVAIFISITLVARGITRPLSRLADAADSLGRNIESQPLSEAGPRELRRAARAFNTMQDRVKRYLHSRTRVLTALSHDLRTPITRLLLRLEAVTDPAVQAKLQQDLAEMQLMVKGTLDMVQGLQTEESMQQVNVEALVSAIRDDFVELGFPVSVEGSAARPLLARPQAMRRLLGNLLENARKFAHSASIAIMDDAKTVTLIVRDDGPGIPSDQLELVMEPYYRVEPSRCRETGGIGLGLSIARDIAQGHGGTLRLHNNEAGGLEATITIPRGS